MPAPRIDPKPGWSPLLDKGWIQTLQELEQRVLLTSATLGMFSIHDSHLGLAWAPLKITTTLSDAKAPRWDASETLELNPKLFELRVVLGWICYAAGASGLGAHSPASTHDVNQP